MENKKISYFQNISLFLLGIVLLAFPIFTTSITTDYFIIPKQALLGVGVLIVLLLMGIKMVADKGVKLRRTPFDLAVALLTVVVFVSSLLSVNRIEAVTAFVPFFLAVLAYFVIVNVITDKKSLNFLRYCLLGGATILAVLYTFSAFNIFLLPFEFAKTSAFSPIGSIFDQAIYLILVLPLALYPVLRKKGEEKGGRIALAVMSALLLVGFSVSVYNLIKQQPVLLPFEVGFQTAFAAISQDAGRTALGFFFGSGYGTYLSDFTRFRDASINADSALWAVTFLRSSSFALELLATTGILGFLAFVYLVYKIIKEKPLYPSLVLAILAAFLLPLSFVTASLFFILLAIYAATQGLKHSNKYYDVELQVVALKKGLISFETPTTSRSEKNTIMPVVFLIIFLIIIGSIGFYGTRFLVANAYFQKSLQAAAENNGSLTYQEQVRALSVFSENDSYLRVFSQTNLALASSLLSQIPEGSTPSAQTSQTIYTLIQQAINSARSATTFSPQNSLNWENLSSIYRSLIGFGQNADQFAILTAQQAVALDPNNPQQYINLGGIYYQLGDWDRAAQQFQVAINLKPDMANAYYNLGHAFEQKGDYQAALAQYQTVRTLVSNNQESTTKINEEIKALQEKAGQVQAPTAGPTTPAEGEQDIDLAQPETQLPAQEEPVKIPGPSETPVPSPTPAE